MEAEYFSHVIWTTQITLNDFAKFDFSRTRYRGNKRECTRPHTETICLSGKSMTAVELMTSPDALPATYDLFLLVGPRPLIPQLADRGISLSADRIGWQRGGQDHHAPLSDIVEINLQLHSIGLDVSEGALGAYGSCRILFRGARELHFFDCSSSGAVDPKAASLYRAFIGDLHHRLGSEARAHIKFTRGAPGRYRIAHTLNIMFGLAFSVPLLILLFLPNSPKLNLALLFLTCGAMFMGVDRLARTIKPGRYDPAKLPGDLI